MDDLPLTKDELNSELTGFNKGEKNLKKKQLIIGLVFGILLLISVILIIVLHASGTVTSSDGDKDIDEKDKDNITPSLPVIGEINCVYEVQSDKENTILLGNEYNKNSDLDFELYIDDKKIKYSKYFIFDKVGNHNVQLKIYKDLNMDYMFKGVKDLISVEMKSENKCQILSMISTFEDCINLNTFNITGFVADNLKSMKKLFYKSSINDYYFSQFNTINLKDISYMFASSPITYFSFDDFNLNQVTDMSHLFEE